jgi:glycosyltransferase involved in cell wall biosynthesis
MSEPVNVFLLCHNEEAIIRQTIEHYQRNLKDPIITILDNESTDNSANIAREMGCRIFSVQSNGIMNEFIQTEMKNGSGTWKSLEKGWVIIADMDEWLQVTQKQLLIEECKGTTVLSVQGYNMMSDSESTLLADVDLSNITFGYRYSREDKNICFLLPFVDKMNFDCGAHNCSPTGTKIKFSETPYILKHMAWLGLPYFLMKMEQRRQRATIMSEQYGLNKHYYQSDEHFVREFRENWEKSGQII